MTESLCKVYLQNDELSINEIRKFTMPLNMETNFNSVYEKMKQMFPVLRDKNFSIAWKDCEADEITVSSDEELKYLVGNIKIPVKLYVKILTKKQEAQHSTKEKVTHFGVCCDNCDGNVVGFRYKCIQCDDYDLCSQCEATGVHSLHYMIRMPQPLHWHHSKSVFHHLRKILKKNGVHLNKKNTSGETTLQGIHCNIQPWFEASVPYLNNFIDTILEAHTFDRDSSKSCKAEEKQESKEENAYANKNASKKFPGEGKQLCDDAKGDKRLVSDVASNAKQESSATNVAADEWTIVDKSDSTEVNQTSSTSSNINETSAKQIPTSATASPELERISSTLYPEIPKKNVIHHPNPKINNAIESMLKMGFSNQGGLLTDLLASENGDINKALEILQPIKK